MERSKSSPNRQLPIGRKQAFVSGNGRLDMKAQILYDYEIEKVERDGALNMIPLIGYLIETFPQAKMPEVLYTASEHVKIHGFVSEFPQRIIDLPTDDVDSQETDTKGDESSPTVEDSSENRRNIPQKERNTSALDNASLRVRLNDLASVNSLPKKKK